MIILGIDPGYARVGYGIISYEKNKYRVIEYGSITTEAGVALSKRLFKIHQELEEIIKRYKIDCSSIEELFFNTNTKTAINVAQARGVILSTLEENNIPVYEYTPLQVKQALVGYGRADKLQIKSMVKTFLCLDKMPKLDDTTDALALSICHCHSFKYNNIK
jgi:crossover junction endodeoxyribonuclease RuvC